MAARAYALLFAAALSASVRAQASAELDAGLQRLLAISGGFSATDVYANTAAVASCGTVSGVTIRLPPLPFPGFPYNKPIPATPAALANLSWAGGISFLSQNTAPFYALAAYSDRYAPTMAKYVRDANVRDPRTFDQFCGALLDNGCIISASGQPNTSAPFFCVPAGLGSRFLSVVSTQAGGAMGSRSVLPGSDAGQVRGWAIGGVTDTGALVLFGASRLPEPFSASLWGLNVEISNWQRCVFFQGPFTAMATTVYMRPSPYALRVNPAPAATLCALTRAGALECWDVAGTSVKNTWWADANGPWPSWATFNASTAPPNASACLNGTRLKLLVPSTALCPFSSPAACVAPFALSSFSISSCIGSGTYIMGVRLSDRVPVAWLVGFDTFDSPPAANSSAGPSGIFAAARTPALASAPLFPPVLECAPFFDARRFVGRLANGSFYSTPEVVEQGLVNAAGLPLVLSNATAAGVAPIENLWTFGDAQAAVLLGPFPPFAYTATSFAPCEGGYGFRYPNFYFQVGCQGPDIPAQQYSQFQYNNALGIRVRDRRGQAVVAFHI